MHKSLQQHPSKAVSRNVKRKLPNPTAIYVAAGAINLGKGPELSDDACALYIEGLWFNPQHPPLNGS